MVINTNIASINAHRNMRRAGKTTELSAMRLSSGLRINTAADDAAGLAISEKMRAQIRGLGQASRNSQDGISLIQTAEGGVSEIDNMLKRMRELAVQAANDTNTPEDRAHIQREIDQLIDEIDALADRTEFNTLKLLSGKYDGADSVVSASGVTVSTSGTQAVVSASASVTDASDGTLIAVQNEILEWLYGSWIADSLAVIQSQTGLAFTGDINLTVQFDNLGAGTIASMTSSSDGINYTLKINNAFLSSVAPGFGESGPVVGGIGLDRVIAHEFMHAVQRNNFWVYPHLVDTPMWFTEGLAEAINGASDTRFYSVPTEASLSSLLTPMLTNPSANAYNGGYLAVMYMDAEARRQGHATGIQYFFDALAARRLTNAATAFEDAFDDVFKMSSADLINKMITEAASDLSAFLSDNNLTNLGDGASSYMLGGGPPSSAAGVIPNSGGAASVNLTDGDTLSAGGITISITWVAQGLPGQGDSLHLQIGANAGQAMYVNIGTVNSGILFGGALSVTDFYASTDTIIAIDGALDYTTSIRAKLGAYQNRLEYTIKSLDISYQNLSASESRIRDADMAKEMMTLTQGNVMQQAAASMLAQANQSVTSVLQLLGA